MRAAWREVAWPQAPALLQQLCLRPACWATEINPTLYTATAAEAHLSSHTCPHTRTRATPLSHTAHAVQQYATYAFQAKAEQAKAEPDWRQHTRSQFSIRPSLMSPLYCTYQQELQKDLRRQAVSHLLDAHSLLSSEIDGLDAAQVERTAKHRALTLQQLSRDLRDLASRTNLPTCSDSSTMLGFYTLLEQQLGAGQGAAAAAATASTRDVGTRPGQVAGVGRGIPRSLHGAGAGAAQSRVDQDDAQLYYDVSHGKVSVWDAWHTQFAQRYAGTPSLPPLEAIYAIERAAEAGASDGQAALGAGQLQAAPKPSGPRGARMDASGIVRTEGKRKTSLAKVTLREGHGQFLVNGLPYDLYFTELAHRAAMLAPLLQLPKLATAFNMNVTVAGGGKSAQAQAVKTGLTRGLLLFKTKVTGLGRLMIKRMAVWDGRQVERKKPGRPKARKSFTYVRR